MYARRVSSRVELIKVSHLFCSGLEHIIAVGRKPPILCMRLNLHVTL